LATTGKLKFLVARLKIQVADFFNNKEQKGTQLGPQLHNEHKARQFLNSQPAIASS